MQVAKVLRGWSVSPWGVYSVWRRHARVYQNTWLVNFLPPVLEPVIYLISFGYGFTPMVGELTYRGQTVTYLVFIGPAMIGLGLLFQAFFEGAYGCFLRLNFQRTWHGLLTAPLSFSEVFLGEWLWAATRGTIAGLLIGIVIVGIGLYPWYALVVSLPLIFLGGLLFGGMGLLAAGIVQTIDQINVPVFLLIVPMFTLCGTYFPIDNLPPLLRSLATVLPLSPMVSLLRWPLGLPPSWPLQLVWLVGLMMLMGYLAWRQIHRKLFG